MNHQNHLKNLLKKFLLIGIETDQQKEIFMEYMGNWIPKQEAPRIFQENGLSFSGNEKQLCSQSYFSLRDDTQTEYLKDKELNERLYDLVLEVIGDNAKFKKPTELTNKIEEFLGNIIKPLKEYEVLFKIQNMDAKFEELVFWDCKIARYDKTSLIGWGFQEEKRYLHGINDFENQNLILVKEKGNNTSEVFKRARIKASKRLRTLQTYLKEGYIEDYQLRFELSEDFAGKEIDSRKIIGTGISSENSPRIYDNPKYIIENTEKANADYLLIKNFSPPIQDLLERTLYWIGLSISEIEMDLKIAFLCTALETLLTTKDDKRKGEKIAYRGYLLLMEINPDGFYLQPHKALRVYELRSTIVHGSRFGITTDKDYWSMLKFTQQTFSNFINFANKHNLGKQSKIYKKLLQSEHLIPFMTWLSDFFYDNASKNIVESIKEDLFKKN